MAAYNPFDENHYVRNAQQDIQAICEPLFKKLDLNYFHYFRANKDGSAIILQNRMDWSDHFYQNQFKPRVPLANQDIKLGQYNVCLWRNTLSDQVVNDARNLCNFDHPLNVSIAHDNYFECFAFGTRQGNDSILNTYFNNMDSIIQFTDQFKEQGAHIIQQAAQHKVVFPDALKPIELDLLENQKNLPTLDTPNGQIKCSYKELEVLKLLARGFTAKEMANQLNRSSRTVEMHIQHLKQRLNCYRTSELVNIAIKNKLAFLP